MKAELTIGITNTEKYPSYERWILVAPGVKTVCLTIENGLRDAELCDGVLFTGSVEDIHPRFYNKPEFLSICDRPDERRDEFELELLGHVFKRKVPVLGICRGLQIVNVYFGGTLIPDIPASSICIHPDDDSGDSFHAVEIKPGSLLASTGMTNGTTNSAHHQAVDRPGKGLIVTAISPDGVVEGLEFNGMDATGYLMLVQWHPERLVEKESKFAAGVRHSFLSAAEQFQVARQ